MNPSQENNKEEAPSHEKEQQLLTFEDVLLSHQKGVKLLQGNDSMEALEYLSKALQAGCKLRGEMHPSLKVLYLDYGRGLLQKIAEMSTDVLAPIFENNEEEGQNQDKEPPEVYDKNSPRIESCNQEEGQEKKNEEQQNEAKEMEQIQENGVNKEEEKHKEEEMENPEASKEQDKKRDISDPEAAWELLELARVLGDRDLQQRDDRVNLLFQADVHMRLGDLETMRENLDKAMQEYQISLELRKRVEDEKYSRLLAETYFMIGQLVAQIPQKVDQAPQYMEQARDILLNCLMKEVGVDEITNMQEFLITRKDDLAEVKNLKQTIADLNAKVRGERAQMMEVKEDKPVIPDQIKQFMVSQLSALVSGFTELSSEQKDKVNDLGKILTKKQKEKQAQRMQESEEGKENKPEIQTPSKGPHQSEEKEGQARGKTEEGAQLTK